MNMILMQVLPGSGYRRVPWRNGAGETAEIVLHPADATADAFDWRVSMAPVVADGPFSRFPGIDRILTVIEGDGLALAIDGAPPVTLGREPFAFSGDLPCEARLAAGPIVDLNVMTRRGVWRAEVRWTAAPAPVAEAAHHLVFAALEPLAGRAAGRPFALDRRDTLRLGPGESATLELAGRWLDIQLVPCSARSP